MPTHPIRDIPVCGQSNKIKTRNLNLLSWNVRTLLDLTGSDRPHWRTALVAVELRRCNIDIAAVSETRFLDKGSIKEEGMGYTFFWNAYPLVDNICMVWDWQ